MSRLVAHADGSLKQLTRGTPLALAAVLLVGDQRSHGISSATFNLRIACAEFIFQSGGISRHCSSRFYDALDVRTHSLRLAA